MNDYHFTLAGIRTVLRTPYPITISESLQPFLCTQHEDAEYIIELQVCDSLPPISQDGLWHGAEYYDCHQGTSRIFHCAAQAAAAFAVTQLFETGNIKISILPEYLSYFTGTAGIFNRIGMETLLLQHHGLLLHASLIKYNGNAIAFSGPSGVGKSTQADIWNKYLGAQILNGDRAAVRQAAQTWIAYGSPYAGTSGIYKNDSAPLRAIIILRQGAQNQFLPLTPGEALRYLYPELSIHHWDKTFVENATDLCLQLLSQTPVYLLECLPQESAALLTKKGLGL